MIVYYTDGSCEPNPGTGGFAVIRDMKVQVLGGDTTPLTSAWKAQPLLPR